VQNNNGHAIFVIGPTASGKTAFAHRLADQLWQQFNIPCGLVNLDAFQFYRGVDLGTAKPSPAEVLKYKYRGIDILDATESVDAAGYSEFVHDSCRELNSAGQMAICVGGSGLYLRSVLHGLDPLPPRNDALRTMFRASADAWGWPVLHGWLEALAPERAAQLHPNDKTRIERALEIVFGLPDGVAPQQIFKSPKPLAEQDLRGNFFVFQVDCDDGVLKTRIRSRIDSMFDSGWIAEVKELKKNYGRSFLDFQAGKAIGYREIFEKLDASATFAAGDDDENDLALKERISVLTWQYVRRQRTWNAKEIRHASFDSSGGIAEIQFDASFLSYISGYRV